MNLPLDKTRWPTWALELWTERSGIMEFDGGMSRQVAELRAEQDVRKQAARMDQSGRERVSA
jgi:hypothetical protein